MKYILRIEPEAQAWLDAQSDEVRKRVFLILDEFIQFPRVAGKQMQNPRWYKPEYGGWARRIHIDSVLPGLRCIYFVDEQAQEMIVAKIGTHADDVYEDGN